MPFCGYCGRTLAPGESCGCEEALQKNGSDSAGMHDYICQYCGAKVAAGEICTCAKAQFEARYTKIRSAAPINNQQGAYQQNGYPNNQGAPYQQNNFPNNQGVPYQQNNFPNNQGIPYQQNNFPNNQGGPYRQNNFPNNQGTPYRQNNFPNNQGTPYRQNNFPNNQGVPYQQNNFPNNQGAPYQQNNFPNNPNAPYQPYYPQSVRKREKSSKGKLILAAYVGVILLIAALFYFTNIGSGSSSSSSSKKKSSSSRKTSSAAETTNTKNVSNPTEPGTSEFVPPGSIEELPEDFSLVDEGLVTCSVYDQGDYGSCFAFSWVGAMENRLLAQGEEEDLSEWAYYKSFNEYYRNANRTNDIAAAANLELAFVPEDKAPYPDKKNGYEIDPDMEKQSSYIISDVYYVSGDGDEKNEVIEKRAKQFLYDGYALVCSVYYDDDSEVYTDNYNGAWYVDKNVHKESKFINHSVLIVGWDDNYSKDNFLTTPPGDGAWLVKNSWGEFMGDDGYYWLSYYDKMFPYSELAAIDIKSSDICEGVQSYWCYGWDYSYFTRHSNTAINGEPMDKVYQACTYTAEKDIDVTAISFFTVCDNIEYTAYVIAESDKSVSYNDTAAKGIQHSSGYHLVELDSPHHIKKGEDYTIIIYMESPEKDYLIVQDSEYSIDKPVSRPATTGTCYVSGDGKNWRDVNSFTLINDTQDTSVMPLCISAYYK